MNLWLLVVDVDVMDSLVDAGFNVGWVKLGK